MESSTPRRAHHHFRNAVLVLLAVGFTFGALWRFTSLHDHLTSRNVLHWAALIRGHPWTPVGVAVVFVLGGLLFFVHAFLLWTTVFTFDPWHAFLYCELGSIASALALYSLGRVLKRDVVKRIAGSYMGELSEAMGRRGILSVILLHLFPICPFSMLNLLCGATHIRFKDFMIGTWIGMTPGLIVLVFFGNAALKIIKHPSPLAIALFILFIIIGFFVLRTARRKFLKARMTSS